MKGDYDARTHLPARALHRRRGAKIRGTPGIEPGTSRTRNENHTTRPSAQVLRTNLWHLYKTRGWQVRASTQKNKDGQCYSCLTALLYLICKLFLIESTKLIAFIGKDRKSTQSNLCVKNLACLSIFSTLTDQSTKSQKQTSKMLSMKLQDKQLQKLLKLFFNSTLQSYNLPNSLQPSQKYCITKY